MTNDDFEIIAANLHQSASREAVRMVLVHGIASADAARLQKITPSSVSDALGRIKKMHSWAKIAAKIKLSDER